MTERIRENEIYSNGTVSVEKDGVEWQQRQKESEGKEQKSLNQQLQLDPTSKEDFPT